MTKKLSGPEHTRTSISTICNLYRYKMARFSTEIAGPLIFQNLFCILLDCRIHSQLCLLTCTCKYICLDEIAHTVNTVQFETYNCAQKLQLLKGTVQRDGSGRK
jgi:hypothetical protein